MGNICESGEREREREKEGERERERVSVREREMGGGRQKGKVEWCKFCTAEAAALCSATLSRHCR